MIVVSCIGKFGALFASIPQALVAGAPAPAPAALTQAPALRRVWHGVCCVPDCRAQRRVLADQC